MNLEFSEEQKMLMDSARGFLESACPLDKVREWESLPEGYPSHMWPRVVEMGWTGVIYPEAYGGLDLSIMDATLLMREMGRVALSTPFLSTVLLSGRAILEGGSEEQKKDVLPAIVEGKRLVSFGFSEANARPNAASVKTTARAEDGGYVLSGSKHFVEFAEQADQILIAARTSDSEDPEQGLTLFLVDARAPGIHYETLKIMALQPQARVTLDNVYVDSGNVVGEVDQAWSVLNPTIQVATVVLCGYMTGLAERALDMAINYSKERVQYEQPIGAFQAIQNYLAAAWTKTTMGEYMAYYAAWLIDNDISSREAVATAKAFVGYASVEATQVATQLHGGMGATADARTTPFLKWAKQLQHTLGSCTYHETVVAQEIIDKDPLGLDVSHSVALT
ncbi:MAG: acyl-CoA/acyl-ACP dehydrogenase [Halieaceae bacterium]|jgi:alkylation response protein AidB-like acyl-CoA dehydrogenase|nr:acyl-CoA/acyl-ACP dehydrogenase [Halieaceae bacterium]